MAALSSTKLPALVGRYVLHEEIASGGMATVHFGRLQGAAGFARSVAIKRLHPQFAKDPDFVAMFVDEARLAARIAHPNVVPTLDVVSQADELLLVMEYVRGASLSRLLRSLAQKGERVPPRIATSIVSGVLHGLHAAHEATSESGDRLDIVHRDVSPQNVLVGTDGVARLLDFGVAKATGRWQSTRDGQLKGKIAYMAPEQITTGTVTRKTDLYATGVVLWETLTGRRLFRADNEAKLLAMVLGGDVQPPSALVEGLPPEFDRIVMRALQRNPAGRFATAREMAAEVEAVVGPAPPAEVGEWVERVAFDELRERANRIGEIERSNPSIRSSPSAMYMTANNKVVVGTRAILGRSAEPATVPAAARGLLGGHEPTSQVSHLARVHTDQLSGLLRKPRIRIAAAAVLVACAIGTTVLALRPSPSVHSSDARSAGNSSAIEPVRPTAAGPTSPWTPIPTAVLAATAPPALVPAPPAPALAVRTGKPVGYSRQTPAPAVARSPCVPPYTVDAMGHMHFKPACVN